MNCCITDLRNKEVINSKNGCRLGCVSDVEICCDNGQLTAIIIWGRGKLFGFSSREGDIRIPWKDIQVIGEETVLVCLDECQCDCNTAQRNRKKVLDLIFK